MRIVGGAWGGRKLLGPGRQSTATLRPTSDRAREGLFNVLGNAIRGGRVLDLFAGTGALGIEALSRGAVSAVFVDHSPDALELIVVNLRTCLAPFVGQAEQGPRVDVLRRDLRRGLAFLLASPSIFLPFDVVFLDPPYGKKLAHRLLTTIGDTGILAPEATVVVEERAGDDLPVRLGCLQLLQTRSYGENGFWFYRKNRNDDQAASPADIPTTSLSLSRAAQDGRNIDERKKTPDYE